MLVVFRFAKCMYQPIIAQVVSPLVQSQVSLHICLFSCTSLLSNGSYALILTSIQRLSLHFAPTLPLTLILFEKLSLQGVGESQMPSLFPLPSTSPSTTKRGSPLRPHYVLLLSHHSFNSLCPTFYPSFPSLTLRLWSDRYPWGRIICVCKAASLLSPRHTELDKTNSS